MFSNYTPFIEDNEEPYFIGQESWDAFIQNESQNLSSRAPPAPGVSEIVFEKPMEIQEKMEEDDIPYDQELYMRKFPDEFDFSRMRRQESVKLTFEISNNAYETQDSDCGRRDQETEEETGSVTTMDSALNEGYPFDSDGLSVTTGDQVFDDAADIETELTRMIVSALNDRSDEEKAYVEKVFPMLLAAVKQVLANSQLPLSDQIVGGIVNELVFGKKRILEAEKEVLGNLTELEMDDVRQERPEKMIEEDELAVSYRKEKKAIKGNRNSSSMNHFNENYVSNIFQFARRNYPEDKEIQRIGNARNVSASNFKRLIGTKLADSVMTRRAKARITESGRELVENIEYWMRDGYLDQCVDREKYIYHKEKALRDLALSGKY